jgi:hypothetical protein
MAAEVREQIMALLAIEPQTPSILRQLEFLERDLARLEAPPAPAQGNNHPVNSIELFPSHILHICILFFISTILLWGRIK